VPAFCTEIWVPRSREEVFAFFADPANLERVTPPEFRFRVLTSPRAAMAPGAAYQFGLRVWGVPCRWRSRIVRCTPPEGFVDEQTGGPYRRWVHTHEFREERGGTRIVDRIDYELPLGPLTLPFRPLIAAELARLFHYRQAAVQAMLGSGPAGGPCYPEAAGPPGSR
jgi:ligand-binding SRPBCC domain-containing protein